MNRYSGDSIARMGKCLSSHDGTNKIYKACQNGRIKFDTRILKEGERLDVIAGQVYNDASYWWVIAAASGIAWPLQVPAGVYLRIPVSLADALGQM